MTRFFGLCLAVALLSGCSHDEGSPLVGSYYHQVVGGTPFDPRAEPGYSTGLGSRQYMALCLYEDDSYAYLTHYWNVPHGDFNEIDYGDFSLVGTDSLLFTGRLSGRFGRRDGGKIDMGSGIDVFYQVDWVYCPPTH